MKASVKFGLTAVAEGVVVLALAACGGGDAGADGAANSVDAAAESGDMRVLATDTVFPKISITGGDWNIVGKTRSLTGLATDNVAVAKVAWWNARNNVSGTASHSSGST